MIAHNVVMSLLKDLYNKGYHVYVDNFYTSPTLFVFEACGTVQNDRKGLSKRFQNANLSKGKIIIIQLIHVICLGEV